MKSMTQLLAALNQIYLDPVTRLHPVPFVAWAWDKPPAVEAWGVIAPDGARADWAGNGLDDQAITGTVDLFTRTDIGDLVDAVQAVLNDAGVSWRMSDMLYDQAARAAHIIWDWETVEGL